MLGFLIGDRNSQDDFQSIKEASTSEEEQRNSMLKEWHKYHPYASWSLLHQALLYMGKKQTAALIKREYLKRAYED